jgi:hypothetical protein
MYEYAEGPGGSEPGGDGLGTLVVYGNERLIITHDHWSHLTPNLHEIEFRNAEGKLLLTLDRQSFQTLIVYRDGGTMVLRAPLALNSLVPAMLGTTAGVGDTVWVARRDPDFGRMAVEVIPATVIMLENGASPSRMRLRNIDGGAVIPGDSGGGVWVNGMLAGNLWAAGFREESGLWDNLFSGPHDEATDLVIAALQPFGSRIGLGTPVQLDVQPGGSDQLAEEEQEMFTKEAHLQMTLLVD